MQLSMLCLAVFVYAGFGSPTPDQFGWAEAMVGGLLVFAVGVSGVFAAFQFNRERPLWASAGKAFFIFGLSIPLVIGALSANDPAMLVRDFVAFLFMVLAVLIWPLYEQPRTKTFLSLSAVLLGFVFAMRALWDVPFLARGEELYYLANMPSVLFAVIFCAGSALVMLCERINIKTLLRSLGLLIIAGVCVLPMIETQQRASIGAFVLSTGILMVLKMRTHPKNALAIMLMLCVPAFVFWPDIQNVLDTLGRKTELVGVNMRTQEWQAVWAEVSSNPLPLFFGQGWGASFASPAVADIEVNFTHGLLSSLLLKTGLIGFALGGVYIGALLWALSKRFQTFPAWVLAIAAPVLIDCLLYASFKSLDFGLVLALIPALLYSKESIKQP
ncbi:MAG: O-antigen ligase family protein [Pseudomonadota bacterium]